MVRDRRLRGGCTAPERLVEPLGHRLGALVPFADRLAEPVGRAAPMAMRPSVVPWA
jgi:hypothetical protein